MDFEKSFKWVTNYFTNVKIEKNVKKEAILQFLLDMLYPKSSFRIILDVSHQEFKIDN